MRRPLYLLLSLVFSVSCVGCGGMRLWPTNGILAEAATDLQPVHDRDHFVYQWERLVNGKLMGRGTHIEHITALSEEGEFEVAIAEDGRASERLHLRVTATGLDLVAEEDLNQGIRIEYEPPLPQLRTPVRSGVETVSGSAVILRIDDRTVLSEVPVTQILEVSSARGIESSVGNFDRGVTLHARRTMASAVGPIDMETIVLLVPGVGEIRSEGLGTAPEMAEDAPTPPKIITRRQLVCAIVDGKGIGNCRKIAREQGDY